jgi:hypothetical protein
MYCLILLLYCKKYGINEHKFNVGQGKNIFTTTAIDNTAMMMIIVILMIHLFVSAK